MKPQSRTYGLAGQAKLSKYWLRKPREKKKSVQLFDFPIQIRIKPTAHKQYCYLCRESITKDSPQVLAQSGSWLVVTDKLKNRYVHSMCGDIPITNLANNGGAVGFKEHLYTRNIYLHTNCFSCLMKKMFAEMSLPLVPDCDTCPVRFDCYTGNIDITNKKISDWQYRTSSEFYPTYTPSRPCGRKVTP